jgi:hypothetical protein
MAELPGPAEPLLDEAGPDPLTLVFREHGNRREGEGGNPRRGPPDLNRGEEDVADRPAVLHGHEGEGRDEPGRGPDRLHEPHLGLPVKGRADNLTYGRDIGGSSGRISIIVMKLWG